VRRYRLLLDALVGDRLLQCVHLEAEGIMEGAEPQLRAKLLRAKLLRAKLLRAKLLRANLLRAKLLPSLKEKFLQLSKFGVWSACPLYGMLLVVATAYLAVTCPLVVPGGPLVVPGGPLIVLCPLDVARGPLAVLVVLPESHKTWITT
jgi:hypothetical protein